MKADFYAEVYNIVKEIPEGNVVTYGQLAKLARRPQCSRMVGQAMFNAPRELNLPCHRVVNSPGEIGSQLDGTKGTAGKRRHRFQKERVRGFKEAYLGGDIAHYLRYVTPSQSSLSPKSISTPLSI